MKPQILHHDDWLHALELLATRGRRLQEEARLEWTLAHRQAVARVRFDLSVAQRPILVAIVGGASSGKSTLFNNLIGGLLASRVTAKGHATLGMILAVHRSRLAEVKGWIERGLFFPELAVETIERESATVGSPDRLQLVDHEISALRDILLFDTPDFTSHASLVEGDLTFGMLPWFDRLIVVIDHERWFDRQTFSELKAQSERLDQSRMALFNRTLDEPFKGDEERLLERQSQQLGAFGHLILNFQRGRGFRRFPENRLDPVVQFSLMTGAARTARLKTLAADAARQIVKELEERRGGYRELEEQLRAQVRRTAPDTTDCLYSLMTKEEQERLQILSRVLRIKETGHWLRHKRKQAVDSLGRVWGLGMAVKALDQLLPGHGSTVEAQPAAPKEREALALDYVDQVIRRLTHEVQRTIKSSSFWDRLSRRAAVPPPIPIFAWNEENRQQVLVAIHGLDRALAAWRAKVESECKGSVPHVAGGLGVGAVALAAVLIAVPGPLTGILVSQAVAAIAGSVGTLAVTTGVGAAMGRQLGRLGIVVKEKLMGSPEFNEVRQAATELSRALERVGDHFVGIHLREASRYVLTREDPMAAALESLARSKEGAR